jgi:hypothetical protein
MVAVKVRDEPPQKWRKMRVRVEAFRVPYETALSLVDVVSVYKFDWDILSSVREVMKRRGSGVYFEAVESLRDTSTRNLKRFYKAVGIELSPLYYDWLSPFLCIFISRVQILR